MFIGYYRVSTKGQLEGNSIIGGEFEAEPEALYPAERKENE